ncbi:carbohydrate-binding protein [Francisella sp. 19X1-34]|uniref:carbohydrate-binding protein n=1 Tax=Francisella sp. 19X1-34 TaxID=3087177 RepID=UPI002E31D76F|nr:carbohydrate-binding protein [Francisella sp. 19X1-34]MED7787654.1 hypothetical protein [Francisella sp. 19X1-34]
MSLRKRKYNDGVALVFAISVAAVLMIMGFLLFALVRSDLFIQKSEKQNLEKRIQIQQAFKAGVASGSQFVYNENTIPSGSTESKSLNGSNAQYTVEISNSDASSGSSAFVIPEGNYTMRTREYYVNMTLANRVKNIVINVPSITQPSFDSLIDKSTISLNIPAINFNELSESQLNATKTLTDKEVGYVGSLTVDGNTQTLEFTAKDGADPKTLNLSGFESGTLTLSQGWVLKDGLWSLSIGVFNPETEEGCVINSTLENFESNFSSLECVPLDSEVKTPGQLIAKYPNPTSYPLCVEGDRYSQGDICQEDGILFAASKNHSRAKLPFQRARAWRVYYPASDWITPYTQGTSYNNGNLVAYDGIVFRSTTNNQQSDPFSNKNWRVDGVYAWNSKVRYLSGDIVTYNGEFYQANNTVDRVDTVPSSYSRWTNIGSTLKQENINELPTEAQTNVFSGTTTSDYKPVKIIFPYRLDLDVNNPEDLLYLRCTGQLPQINTTTYKQCINGQTYEFGDMCYENNMLFTAQYYTTESPFYNPNAWRLFIPSLEWVTPYTNNVTYGNNITKVLFDGKVFVNNNWIGEGENPYQSGTWDIDGIYEWSSGVTYKAGDIVISGNNFYKAKWYNKGEDPLVSGQWGAWQDLGTRYEGQIADYYLDLCNGIISAPIIEKGTCDRFSCVVNIAKQSTGGTGIYTYKFYDQDNNLLLSTSAQNSVTINFDAAGDYTIHAIAEDSEGTISHPSITLDYNIESQLTKDPITYLDPTGYGPRYTDKLFSNSGLTVTATTDYITFNCPTGYSFIKGAETIKSRKQETYKTYDGSTYLMKGVRILADRNTDSAGSVVYTGSSVLYQNNLKGKKERFKYRNYYTRAVCVPDESDGHWDI